MRFECPLPSPRNISLGHRARNTEVFRTGRAFPERIEEVLVPEDQLFPVGTVGDRRSDQLKTLPAPRGVHLQVVEEAPGRLTSLGRFRSGLLSSSPNWGARVSSPGANAGQLTEEDLSLGRELWRTPLIPSEARALFVEQSNVHPEALAQEADRLGEGLDFADLAALLNVSAIPLPWFASPS